MDWPKGGALLADRDEVVTCLLCLDEMQKAAFPVRFEAAVPIASGADVSIGARVLVAWTVHATHPRPGTGEVCRWRNVRREAWCVGWVKRWTAWKISGRRTYYDFDGSDFPTATPIATGELLRIRFTANGAEHLCFLDDVRLLVEQP